MRIFVYEYTCAELPGPSSLHAEGRAMLSAALDDFAGMPGVETETLILTAVAGAPSFHGARVTACAADEVEALFRQLARRTDFTLVIAPECDGLLEIRSRWVLEEGARLLGSSPEAIHLTGDKLALAEQWKTRGIATPETALIPVDVTDVARTFLSVSPRPDRNVRRASVCKPRFGAGSQATFRVGDVAKLEGVIDQARAEGCCGEMILQPLIPGRPASVAVIVGEGECVTLPPATQELSDDGRFRYRGGVVPLPEPFATQATHLAVRAVSSVPGLRGYVGVDLILGDADDGSGDFAIEINPRLTTSYVGLRALAEMNLAELMLAAAAGQPIPPPAWRPGSLRFTPEGKIAETE